MDEDRPIFGIGDDCHHARDLLVAGAVQSRNRNAVIAQALSFHLFLFGPSVVILAAQINDGLDTQLAELLDAAASRLPAPIEMLVDLVKIWQFFVMRLILSCAY